MQKYKADNFGWHAAIWRTLDGQKPRAMSLEGCVDELNRLDESEMLFKHAINGLHTEVKRLKEENEKYKKHIEDTVAKLRVFIGL